MALFPIDIAIGYETRLAPDAGKRVEKAEDGTVMVINFFTNTVYEGSIVVPFANDAKRSTILDFYQNNKNSVWTFEHPGDGQVYSLYFANEPIVERLESRGDKQFKITIPVVGTL